jgi:hypothetical protein
MGAGARISRGVAAAAVLALLALAALGALLLGGSGGSSSPTPSPEALGGGAGGTRPGSEGPEDEPGKIAPGSFESSSIRSARAVPLAKVGGVTSAAPGTRAYRARASVAAAAKRGVSAKPTYQFSSGTTPETQVAVGGDPADSNVAASATNVCITTRGGFACYTKGGALVAPGAGFDARPYNAADFFGQAGIPVGTPFDNDNGNKVKDGRVVFDQFLHRFFMEFQTREEPARLLIAVSRSQNPEDGWFLYAPQTGNGPTIAQDYDKVGIDRKHFMVSLMRVDTSTDPDTKTWVNFYWNAAALASGQPSIGAGWENDDEGVYAAPVTATSGTSDDSYWVNRVNDPASDQDEDGDVSIWGLRGNVLRREDRSVNTSTNSLDNARAKGSNTCPENDDAGQPPCFIDYYATIFDTPQNAIRLGSTVSWVSNDSKYFAGPEASDADRLVSFDVSNFWNDIGAQRSFDHRYGDGTGKGDYGWPAVAATKNGDLVMGSVFTTPSIYPQVRALVVPSGGVTASAAVVKKSTAPLFTYHMAGASADPNTSGAYISQQYGWPGLDFRIVVAKILGAVHPDLIATKVAAASKMHRGVPEKATVTILNQGDGPMPASVAKLRLTTHKAISPSDRLLKTFDVPALARNQSAKVTVHFTIPTTALTGTHRLGASLNTGGNGAPLTGEYSVANNMNPYLAGSHGNAVVNVLP